MANVLYGMYDKKGTMTAEIPTIDYSNLDLADNLESNTIAMDSTDKQQLLLQIVLSFTYTRILFGGAVGGAKTWGWLFVLYVLCRMFPGSRWVFIRKDTKVLHRNTIPSFWRSCPKPFFHRSRFNQTYLTAKAHNGSEIVFMGENYDKDKELTAFDGLECNGAVMEEAHELTETLFIKLNDRVGRWALDSGIELPAFIFLGCNPTQGWLKKMFYTPMKEGKLEIPYYFLQSLPDDNPYLPQTYWDSLAELKKISPRIWRKRVKGSWEAEDDIQQLISWSVLHECDKEIEFTDEERESELFFQAMGVDVGRYGPDPSVWYVIEGMQEKGFNVIHTEKYDKTSGPQVEQKTKELIGKFGLFHFRVFMDTVGLGGPCYDHLIDDGFEIQAFSGGSTKGIQTVTANDGITQLPRFNNLNSQAKWILKEKAEAGLLGGFETDILKEDLSVYRYDIKGEKTIHVWGKEIIKEKLQRSPDDGDSYTYAVWAAYFDTIQPMPGIAVV
jgi:hypothetical protein